MLRFRSFLIALEAGFANSLLMRQEGEGKKPQVITELQTGVQAYIVLKEEDFRGLFLKTLRSFEKPLRTPEERQWLVEPAPPGQGGLRPSIPAVLRLLGQP